MAFNIRLGLPEMEALWNDLSNRKQQGKLGKEEEKFFKKLIKSLANLAENPRHNSLASHEIGGLTRKYGHKVFQSSGRPKTWRLSAHQVIRLSVS
jgi:hypothetical protein